MRGPVTLYDPCMGEGEAAAAAAVVRSNWLSMGAATAALEDAFAKRLGVPGALAVSSGTAALHLALRVLDVGPGDEVITPSLTFVACPSSVVACGATPVFADVTGLHDLCVSPDDVERRLTPRTRVVVAMHYGGHTADLPRLRALCDDHSLFLVEDAAHTPPVGGPGAPGTVGDAACFSLHATKNVAGGEGGVLVARDPARLQRARRLRSHGLDRTAAERGHTGELEYDLEEPGFNYRPTEVAAAVAGVQLEHEPTARAARREAARLYRRLLCEVEGIGLPFPDDDPRCAHHLFPVLLPSHAPRGEVARAMRAAAVQVGFHYPPAHLMSFYRRFPGTAAPGSLPFTEEAGRRLLSLPMHARLEEDDVRRVCEALQKAVESCRSAG